MRKLIAIFCGLFSACQPVNANADRTVSGNSDRWMLFERNTSKGLPLVILARVGNPVVDTATKEGMLTIVNCVADARFVNERSMPQHTDRLYPLEDLLGNSSNLKRAQAFHVASVTGDGRRQIIYAHGRSVDFARDLQAFSVPGFVCSANGQAVRASLINLMTPTEVEMQLNGDRDLIANLEKQSDNGLTPRKTDFWFYGEKSSLDSMQSQLAPLGFVIDHTVPDPIGVVLARTMPVDFPTFQKLTPVVVEAAKRHSVRYDGWETFVVRSGAK